MVEDQAKEKGKKRARTEKDRQRHRIYMRKYRARGGEQKSNDHCRDCAYIKKKNGVNICTYPEGPIYKKQLKRHTQEERSKCDFWHDVPEDERLNYPGILKTKKRI